MDKKIIEQERSTKSYFTANNTVLVITVFFGHVCLTFLLMLVSILLKLKMEKNIIGLVSASGILYINFITRESQQAHNVKKGTASRGLDIFLSRSQLTFVLPFIMVACGIRRSSVTFFICALFHLSKKKIRFSFSSSGTLERVAVLLTFITTFLVLLQCDGHRLEKDAMLTRYSLYFVYYYAYKLYYQKYKYSKALFILAFVLLYALEASFFFLKDWLSIENKWMHYWETSFIEPPPQSMLKAYRKEWRWLFIKTVLLFTVLFGMVWAGAWWQRDKLINEFYNNSWFWRLSQHSVEAKSQSRGLRVSGCEWHVEVCCDCGKREIEVMGECGHIVFCKKCVARMRRKELLLCAICQRRAFTILSSPAPISL